MTTSIYTRTTARAAIRENLPVLAKKAAAGDRAAFAAYPRAKAAAAQLRGSEVITIPGSRSSSLDELLGVRLVTEGAVTRWTQPARGIYKRLLAALHSMWDSSRIESLQVLHLEGGWIRVRAGDFPGRDLGTSWRAAGFEVEKEE